MLSFATEIPIRPEQNARAFLKCIERWICGSPHSRLVEADFAPVADNSESRISRDHETLDVIRASRAGTESAAVRYAIRQEPLVWETTVVFSKTSTASWVGIRVACEALHPTARLPPVKKPIIIRTILAELGGVNDGPLEVSEKPVRLASSQVDLAAALLLGTAGCRLPIVYLSAPFQLGGEVDAEQLAERLSGMAHVVVEPNRPFSLRLQLSVDSQNVYGGTIGVYWPENGGRRVFFRGPELPTSRDVADAVVEEVRVALSNRRPMAVCTWSHVLEGLSRQRIEALKAAGSRDLDSFVKTFDEEIAAKDQRIKEAEKEIARLHHELRALERRSPVGDNSLLRLGRERDLFPGESYAIIRDALSAARDNAVRDSRRLHVLDSVLSANPEADKASSEYREELKRILRGVRSVDAKVRGSLESMGFSVSEEGKHVKIVFRDDDRYTFTLPKSGSDHRGGLNAASDISRLLF